MASVKLENLGKSFEGNWAVRDIGLEVEKGEMIVIVGPSGCGKSTLLRMIAGLEHSSTGRVSINGVDVNDKEPMDRNVAMVFQNYALYPHMSVYNNMAYGLKIARRPRQEIRQEVLKAAKLLQIEPYLKSKPRQLSGGQRQRVAMGRAIVRRPDLFLFDEPLSNLDAKLRLQMRMEIKLLQRRLGVTAFYVTHDQIEAMTLADRMLVMNEGICDQIGPPLEVYANPKTRFVAGFIGSPPTNFFSARLRGEDQLSEGVIGIRPEHIWLGESTAGIICGRVHYIEPLGAETLVHLQLADGAHVTVRQENHAIIPAPDDLVGLYWNEENEMLFDSKGLRIYRQASSSP